MLKFIIAALACVALHSVCVSAYPSQVYGVDVSQLTSESSFSCLVSSNLTFAVVRAYQSVGRPDPNAAASINNAWNAGMEHVDVYMFPCPTCGNPEGQVSSLVSNLQSHGARFGMLWLDIEGSQYWLGSYTSNRAFFEGLVSEAKNQGLTIGVYSSSSQWSSIMGSYTGGADFPLWYAHYDGQPSFGDFQAFGGWSYPAIKQFSDAGSKCGASYDINWYPA